MSEKVRIPFQFHLRSVQCVSPEEAARLTQSNGLRRGPNDQKIPVEQLDLHRRPELDRMIVRARRAYAADRAASANRAQVVSALSNAASLPRNIPPGVSGLARGLYQSILPPRSAQGSGPPNAEGVPQPPGQTSEGTTAGSKAQRRVV